MEFTRAGDMYYIDTDLNIKSIFERPDIQISDGADCEFFLYSPMNYVAKAYTKGNVDAEILLNSLYWVEYQKQQMA